MTHEEKIRLAEYKTYGSLSQDQAVEYHNLLMKESEEDAGVSEVGISVEEVVEPVEKPKRGRPAKK